MRKSLAEYIAAVFKWSWAMLIGGIASITGAALDVGQTTGVSVVNVPFWLGRTLWITGLVIIVLVAQLLAFHKVRVERDRALERLNSHPTLWIRSKGVQALSDARKLGKGAPRRLAWYFDVNITNASPDKNLGIRSIVLEIKRGNTISTLRATMGTLGSDFDDAPEGTIPGFFTLQPNQPIAGTLVFEETEWGEQGSDNTFDRAMLVLIDSQDKVHRFATDSQLLTNR